LATDVCLPSGEARTYGWRPRSLIGLDVVPDRQGEARRSRDHARHPHRGRYSYEDTNDLGLAGTGLERTLDGRSQRAGGSSEREQRTEANEQVDLRSQHHPAAGLGPAGEHHPDGLLVVERERPEETFDLIHVENLARTVGRASSEPGDVARATLAVARPIALETRVPRVWCRPSPKRKSTPLPRASASGRTVMRLALDT
jgi:hypothetical protein